jgi:imidazolonepropionase-like amidohydrolase
MSKSCVALALTAVFVWTLCQAPQSTGANPSIIIIEGATVIDGVSSEPIRDAVLVIEGDSIRSIGKRGSVKIPPDARTINAQGKTILPGLLSLHVHPGLSEGMEMKIDFYTRERVLQDANAYLYYGVTHVVSLGLDREPMLGILADQRSGKVGGARLYSAGTGFAAKGGWQPVGVEAIHRPTTAEEARAMVQKELEKKPAFIKIWQDDRYGELPLMKPDIYGAIIDEAHKHNLRVLAHVRYLDDTKEMIRHGLDGMAHSIRDKEVDAELLSLAKQKGVIQITTLAQHGRDLAYAEGAPFLSDPGLHHLFSPVVLQTLGSKEYQQKLASSPALARTRTEFEIASRNAAKVAAAGIPIVLGTDSGGPGSFPGFSEHREMELLVRAGLTPIQVLQAATINGARFLRVDKKYGSLEAHKIADFIVLNADPLADITNSRKIDSVWMNGKQVDRNALGRF